MRRADAVRHILGERLASQPRTDSKAEVFAPANIALCKYWGKRDTELNLPATSSLSVSLPDRGSHIVLSLHAGESDAIRLNDAPVSSASSFYRRFTEYLDLFRTPSGWRVNAEIRSSVPVGAGLASSASGFASIVIALDQWLDWRLTREELSILARLGSGSACRSLWNGFVEWEAGSRPDGMDSHGVPLSDNWPGFCIGLMIFTERTKPISSREAMQRTVQTSRLYRDWPDTVERDLCFIKKAIHEKNFHLLGKTAESNAMAMHATLRDAEPSINYDLPETLAAMEQVRQFRETTGTDLYFTQDAGPNLKLLFMEQDLQQVARYFPGMQTVRAFPTSGV